MYWVNPLLTLREETESAVANASAHLKQSGMHVVRSFDLQSACASPPGFICPHHGENPCNCQMVVLLIYDGERGPVCMVAHGYNGRTQFGFSVSPGQNTDPGMEKRIATALRQIGRKRGAGIVIKQAKGQ